MTEIKLIEANLSSEWSCPEDEEFWKDRIGMLVEYVRAAELKRRDTNRAHFEDCVCLACIDLNRARKALRLEDK